MTLADRAWAHIEQTRIARRFAAAFENYDLILSPTTPMSPFPWTELYATEVDGQKQANYYRWLGLTYAVTLPTNPALALPCGADEQGMPFGLQMVGRLRGDQPALMSAALALEQVLSRTSPALRRPVPDLAALRQPRPELRSIITHPAGTGGQEVRRDHGKQVRRSRR